MKSTGKILRRKRLDKDISATRLAELAGVSKAYVSAVENGKRPPSANYMNKLKEIFIFTTEELEEINIYESCKKLPGDFASVIGGKMKNCSLTNKIDQLTDEDKRFVTEIIDTLILKNKLKEIL